MFSSQDGTAVYRFLWADRFPWAPLLEQVLGAADAGNVMRVQLARMPPGGRILRHADTGGYAAAGHRIHVVVQSNPGARGQVAVAGGAVAAAAGRRGFCRVTAIPVALPCRRALPRV